ncbi:hypothetical protein [uncultured Ramlibacter sp.]|uniref:hypothetical protein n=1 Tax=uncultured Ramlibacter sp. TaxID=260755 RepID=UPI00261C5838|nr:hypothetical protein [uncultured Ramlibacter sp.]
MKLKTLALLLTLAPCAHALEDDKAKHLGVSFALGIAGEQIAARIAPDVNSVALGTGMALVPGILKELYDANHKSTKHPDGFSGKDLAADLVGAFAGALLSGMVSQRVTLFVGKDRAGEPKVAVTYSMPLN